MSRHRVTTQPCRATAQQAGHAGGGRRQGAGARGAGRAARALGALPVRAWACC